METNKTTRRKLLQALALICLTPKLSAAQSKPLVVVAYLSHGSREDLHGTFFSAFQQGMSDFGWKEGREYRIEARFANSDFARLETLANEIATLKPSIIVATPATAVRAAAKFSPRTPIVQANGNDPVVNGFAVSLAKPGGMITGVTNMLGDLSEKNLELLMSASPALTRVGFIHEMGSIHEGSVAGAHHSLSRFKGVEGIFAGVARPTDLVAQLSRLKNQGAQALVILSGAFLASERKPLLRLAGEYKWPVVGGLREYAEAGALLSYGADRKTLCRRAAYFVDRVLKGAKPADLPFEQPTVFELVLNLKAAKALGITFPQSLLVRADEVIQ